MGDADLVCGRSLPSHSSLPLAPLPYFPSPPLSPFLVARLPFCPPPPPLSLSAGSSPCRSPGHGYPTSAGSVNDARLCQSESVRVSIHNRGQIPSCRLRRLLGVKSQLPAVAASCSCRSRSVAVALGSDSVEVSGVCPMAKTLTYTNKHDM